jgi:hypothetical protein
VRTGLPHIDQVTGVAFDALEEEELELLSLDEVDEPDEADELDEAAAVSVVPDSDFVCPFSLPLEAGIAPLPWSVL